MRALAVVGLVLFLLAQPAVSQVPDDKLIVPGQRIGKWTLAMSVDDLARMNGGPGIPILRSAGGAAEADAAHAYTLLQWGTVNAATVDEKRVLWLAIQWSGHGTDAYGTARGVGLQSTRAQVLEAYGKLTAETKPHLGGIRLIYDEIGIWFTFDGGLLRYIGIFRPGTAKSIWKY